MKIHRLLLVAGLLAAGTAMAGHGGSSSVLFVFDGGTFMHPLRGANGVPAANTVAGVAPAGAPWGLSSFQAVIKTTGEIRARGTGVLLLGTDNIGTRGGPRQVILSLFCRNAPVAPATIGSVNPNAFNSAPADLDEDGNFSVRGTLADATGMAPPLTCGDTVDNRPVLLIRSVNTATTPVSPAAWFAAAFISDKRFGKGRDW